LGGHGDFGWGGGVEDGDGDAEAAVLGVVGGAGLAAAAGVSLLRQTVVDVEDVATGRHHAAQRYPQQPRQALRPVLGVGDGRPFRLLFDDGAIGGVIADAGDLYHQALFRRRIRGSGQQRAQALRRRLRDHQIEPDVARPALLPPWCERAEVRLHCRCFDTGGLRHGGGDGVDLFRGDLIRRGAAVAATAIGVVAVIGRNPSASGLEALPARFVAGEPELAVTQAQQDLDGGGIGGGGGRADAVNGDAGLRRP
jgi:hypothetical protein